MKFELIGTDKLRMSFDRVKKSHRKRVSEALQGAALRTVAVAKSRLQPHGEDGKEVTDDIVSVRQTINHTFDPVNLEATIYAGNSGSDHIAAYLEFGTGVHAARYVPTLGSADFTKLAMSFYKNGKGTLREHPFLIPAYMQEGKRLSEKLKNLKVSW
jgi:hypothetical protein